MNECEKLRAFAEMIAIPLSNTDNVKWPIRSGLVISYVNDIFASEFINDLRKLVSDVPKSRWRFAFFNSLSIWKISHHVINGLSKLGLKNDEIAEDILYMCNVLDVLSQDNWNTPKKHIILSNHEVESIYEKYIANRVFTNTSVYTLISSFLWAYSDALFFQGREICCERHGLYSTRANVKMLITDIKGIDEAATCLWPDTYHEIGVDFIRVILVYDGMFEMSIDPYNNTDLVKGSFTNSCCGGAVIVDGHLLSEEELHRLFTNITERIAHQTHFVNHMSNEDLTEKYIDIFWYRKKLLLEYVNSEKTWRPNKSIYRRIDSEKIVLNPIITSKVANFDSYVKMYDYSEYLKY